MEGHVKVVGILHIVYGVLTSVGIIALGIVLMIFGAGVFALFAGISTNDGAKTAAGVLTLVAVIGAVIVGLVVVCGFVSIFIGFGILKRKNWARILAVVLAAFHLVSSVPTAFSGGGIVVSVVWIGLSVYTLWVLLSDEGARLFKQYSH